MFDAASFRPLHWVFRVADRPKVMSFYRDVLGMAILRHEEFDQPCEAACNGPFNGKWSKTMVGFGKEDDHFVVELTYNYDTHAYKLDNDYQHIRIHSKQAAERAEKNGGIRDGNVVKIGVPVDGYPYEIVDEDVQGDPAMALQLRSSNLPKTLAFWRDLLGFQKCDSHSTEKAVLKNALDAHWSLEFIETADKTIDHGTAFGRVAFSCPPEQLKSIQEAVKASDGGGKVLTEYISLDTPGKATVQVVILADPDGYEICFVGDVGFRDLSQVDPAATELLETAMASDKSMEWWLKKKAREQQQ